MNEFVFTTMRCVFVRFLEEIEDSKKAFRNYLTISWQLQSSHTDNQLREGGLNLANADVLFREGILKC